MPEERRCDVVAVTGREGVEEEYCHARVAVFRAGGGTEREQVYENPPVVAWDDGHEQ